MNLTPHFTLAELTVTEHRNIDNTAPPEIIPALTDTAERMEDVRRLLGHPIHVTSGYRCPRLNKAVGSKPTSAHLKGHAVDFVCPAFGSPLEVCRALEGSGIAYDQIIWEQTWVHISFDPRFRRQVLTMQGGVYSTGLGRRAA